MFFYLNYYHYSKLVNLYEENKVDYQSYIYKASNENNKDIVYFLLSEQKDFTVDEITKISISPSMESIEFYAFKGFDSLTKISIPFSVKKIKKYAFDNCSSLKEIIIPFSVTSILLYLHSICAHHWLKLPFLLQL